MSDTLLTKAELADDKLIQRLKSRIEAENLCRCLVDEPLSRHTSWRVGGPARLYVYPATRDALASLLQFCREEKLPTFTIGYGTNLLASDDGYSGCVIDLAEGAKTLNVQNDTLRAGGGVWLGEAVRIAAESGLGGMEKLAGIPGGVGGGMSMNAGAFGMSISDHVVEIGAVTSEGEQITLSKETVRFGYRSAPGLVGKTVWEARFELPRRRKVEVIKEVEATITERFRRNVMTLPSAGSVFKNPPGGFAAKMVEGIGGKGMQEGGVEVSALHANFIVNARGGTAADIIRLVRRIRKAVSDQFGVTLELEVRMLGFDPGVLSQGGGISVQVTK